MLTNKKSSTNVLFGTFIRRRKETTKSDFKYFNLRRDIIRSEGNIEMYNNNEILYVNSNSNHPPKIKQNILDMIGKRISDDTKFNKTVKTYQNALHSSGHKQKRRKNDNDAEK